MLTRYKCGHVGRDNEPGYRIAKAAGFIRLAELRGKATVYVDKPCPGCSAQSPS